MGTLQIQYMCLLVWYHGTIFTQNVKLYQLLHPWFAAFVVINIVICSFVGISQSISQLQQREKQTEETTTHNWKQRTYNKTTKNWKMSSEIEVPQIIAESLIQQVNNIKV